MTSDVWARRALDVKSIVFEVVFLHWGDGVSPETRHPKELGEERLAGSWGKGPSGPQGKASGHVVGSQLPPPRYSCQTLSEAPELPVSVAGSWAPTAKRSGKPPGRHRVSTEAGRRGHERQQHRHLPAAKAELVTAMARERRREQADARMSLRGRSVQTPRTGGRLAFLG